TAGPTDRFHLHLRCSLPEGGQGCSPDHAGLQHRGDELAPRRDRRNRRARCPRHPPGRSSRLALVHPPPRPGQYHHHSAAAEVPRAQPGRERLAVHARQLALQPHLQILRRSRRPLLCGMEQARRSALAHHVHRTAPMGPRVLINGIWYKERRGRQFGLRNLSTNSSSGPVGRVTEKLRASSGWRRKSPSATSLKPAASTSPRSTASSMRWNVFPTVAPSPSRAEWSAITSMPPGLSAASSLRFISARRTSIYAVP